MIPTREAYAGQLWKAKRLFYQQTEIGEITAIAGGATYALVDRDGKIFAIVSGDIGLDYRGDVNRFKPEDPDAEQHYRIPPGWSDLPTWTPPMPEHYSGIDWAHNHSLPQPKDYSLRALAPVHLSGQSILTVGDSNAPQTCPTGPVVLCYQPVAGVPIYGAHTADKSAWYMIPRAHSKTELSLATRNAATIAEYGEPRTGRVWCCFSQQDAYLALLWDYTPLCEALGVDVDRLEQFVREARPQFYEAYTRSFGVGETS